MRTMPLSMRWMWRCRRFVDIGEKAGAGLRLAVSSYIHQSFVAQEECLAQSRQMLDSFSHKARATPCRLTAMAVIFGCMLPMIEATAVARSL
mmetsp:Transcript_24908/g.45735  ORF Transcript_24908/g.45735 Transcript_24908/m.45735 type:complete len:92 (+) Transcript_24908:1063-1338(+)